MTKIQKILKRDGRLEEFEPEKVTRAIFEAAKAVGGDNIEIAKNLCKQVVDIAEKKIAKKELAHDIPTVEEIQDIVEKVLIEKGHAKTAKAYILYREQHKKLRDTKNLLVDVEKTMDGYLQRGDWRVNENASINYSFSGLSLHLSGTLIANYCLNNIYPQEVSQAHINGDFHIHDLSLGINGYCAGWSLKQLLLEGFNGVPGKIASAPPKHMDTALSQMVNFLGTLQNEWAGAQAFSSFDTYLAPYVRYDKLDYKRVKQLIQSYVYNMNVPSRWGCQAPFSNLTFDWTVPEDMKDQPVIIGGKPMKETYGDFQAEMDVINKAFIEVEIEGDQNHRIFTFPIPTYNITRDFNWDSENADLLFHMTGKYGLPYFQNFINSSLRPSDVRAMCCRLQMDMRRLRAKTGGLFGSGESTGSLGVVTLNMPRTGYLTKTKEEFMNRVGHLMELAMNSLELKRRMVSNYMEAELFPYTKRYLGTLNNHFSTIGLVGMNEALLNFMGKNIGTKEGIKFAGDVLDYMRETLTKFQEQTNNIYNLEATPAEGTSYRLARIDKKMHPDIITAGEKEPYYTNSTQLPVNYTDDIFEALQLQDELQTKYTGGTVLHGFLGEAIDDVETTKKLVKRIAHNFRLPYFTLTPTFSICPEHGYIKGKHFLCPIDAKKVR